MNYLCRKLLRFWTTALAVVLIAQPVLAEQEAPKKYLAVPDHPSLVWQPSNAKPHVVALPVRIKASTRPLVQSSVLAKQSNQPLQQNTNSSLFRTTQRQNVDMFVGEVQVLKKQKIDRVAIGRGAVLRAEILDTGELLIIAEATGSSSLRLWHSDGKQSDFNIRVAETDPETRFRMEKMVRMRVRMVELRKSALTRLGIDWADAINGPTLGIAGDAVGNNLYRPSFNGFEGLPNQVEPFSTYFGIASNLTSRINAMTVEGDAHILAEPVLSGTNGGVASFLAGGEVPYPATGANGESVVDFKEYGIRLEIQPRIDSGGNVRAMVKTEISQLDPAVTIQGAPGLLTRRAQTEVNVRSGQTIVISGLLSSEASKDVNRLPGIGRLPILGRLFRSDNVRNNVSELVIFITPEVIDPAGQLLTERDREFERQAQQQVSRAQNAQTFLE